MRAAETIKIGQVKYSKGKFWKVVGWVGKQSCAVREVKPKYFDDSRSGFIFQGYRYRVVDSYLVVKKLDWFWKECEFKSFKEIEEIVDAADNRQRPE